MLRYVFLVALAACMLFLAIGCKQKATEQPSVQASDADDPPLTLVGGINTVETMNVNGVTISVYYKEMGREHPIDSDPPRSVVSDMESEYWIDFSKEGKETVQNLICTSPTDVEGVTKGDLITNGADVAVSWTSSHSDDRGISIFKIDGTFVQEARGYDIEYGAMAFSPSGKYILTGLDLVEIKTGRKVKRLDGIEKAIIRQNPGWNEPVFIGKFDWRKNGEIVVTASVTKIPSKGWVGESGDLPQKSVTLKTKVTY